MFTRFTGGLALGGLFLLSIGCGPTVDPNRPKTHPVTGVVTHNGVPVEGASVLFLASGGGRGAAGRTDAQGNFKVTTFEAGDGAVAGSYRVAIFKTIIPEEPEDAPPAQGGSPDQEPPSAPPQEMLPVKYKDPANSGLKADVSEGGENHFVFDLTD